MKLLNKILRKKKINLLKIQICLATALIANLSHSLKEY